MDITNHFYRHFRLVAANTPDLNQEVYRLRYQVYCLETGFEEATRFPSGMEIDEYDDNSVYYLVQHKMSAEYAATTRLILPNLQCAEWRFPIERYCRIERLDLVQRIQRWNLAEVSRFCISKSFKRRYAEPAARAKISQEHAGYYLAYRDQQRSFTNITLALTAALVRMAMEHGITHWYAVMEPCLLRLFKQIGMDFIAIGPTTNYRGWRIPCLIRVWDLLDGVKNRNLQNWNLLTDYGRITGDTLLDSVNTLASARSCSPRKTTYFERSMT